MFLAIKKYIHTHIEPPKQLSLPPVIQEFQAQLSALATQQSLTKAMGLPQQTHLRGLVGSGLSFRMAAAFESCQKSILFVLDNPEQAAYYLNDLEALLGNKQVLYFPASSRQPYITENTDNANVLLRAEVLKKMARSKKPLLVVTYAEALFEKLISQYTLKKNTLQLKKGDVLSIDFINETLFEYGFERVDFVSQPGEFSVRGGIIDVFSFAYQHPYRIEFFDDEIESLRSFDVSTQLSIVHFDQIDLLPNTSQVSFTDKRKSLIETLATDSSYWFYNRDKAGGILEKLFQKAQDHFDGLDTSVQYPPETLFLKAEELNNQLENRSVILLENSDTYPATKQISFKQSPQPIFQKKFDLLIEHLNNNHENGYTNYLLCNGPKQAQRFHDIFQEIEDTVNYQTRVSSFFEGFEDLECKIACFTDHQIFERYHKFALKSQQTKRDALSLKELTHMQIGDYVTHIDHGIGKFGGLKRVEVEGKWQEAIKLIYGERDVLYLSIHALHKITKYRGKDGESPKVHKLGSKAWKSLKQKTKKKIKEIAFNLIQVYAKRKSKIGYAFAPDSYLQLELESSFIYEDTPDQSTTTADIKADMERDRPMDRLVCGDVGFGKTEVAIRAAFKAVDNSKQVAVLVPTTILAFQHYKTFSKRLADLPVRVDYLNRFRSATDKKKILADLESGRLDILIGTHQLVNKNVKFNDLGLLIVDEEQKFGVAVKEKLRAIKTDVDVLTLTATPIPRTLQFSLMAARDLSVIATPPPNRYPIESEVVRFSEELIRDGILYELKRGGQVYFIHNRVENIREVAGMIQRLVPDAKIGIGHGQMEGAQLEKILLQFMEGEIDILLATTIIENGLDVPNANTIFINNAQSFGLSDLHQMRGRVGRSNKKAFCYFITPPMSAMNSDAQKRIQAIRQFAALGSGYQVAMKDLEIRGAGNLLGGEQSGFINDIGFDAYQKILEEAVEELKTTEFKDLYAEELASEKHHFVKEVQLDTDWEILIPDDYVNSVQERLRLYQQLSQTTTEAQLVQFQEQLSDRFGPIPYEAAELLKSLRLKWIATQLGIERIVIKNQKAVGYFIADQQSPFYQTKRFQWIIQKVPQMYPKVQLKEKKVGQQLKLLLIVDQVEEIAELIEQLTPLQPELTDA